jgi:hypothetical protein
MALWIATLFSQVLAGLQLSLYFLDTNMSLLFVAALGAPAGIGLSTLIFHFCSSVLGQNVVHLSVHTVCLLVFGLWMFRKNFRSARHRLKTIPRVHVISAAVFTVACFYFPYKIYFAYPRALAMSIESQLTEELSLQASFFLGVNSGFVNPLCIHHPSFVGHCAVSRWLMAFHTAMLRTGFASLRWALVVPSFILADAFCVSAFFLALEFRLPDYLAGAAPFVCLLVSGHGYLRFLDNRKRLARANDYVSQFGPGKVTRFHPVLHLLFSFRGSLLALPLVTAIIFVLYWSVKSRHGSNKSMLSFMGFLAGVILPPAQHQAFVGLVVFFVVFLCIQWMSRGLTRELRGFALALIVGTVIHIPRFIDRAFFRTLVDLRSIDDGGVFLTWWHNCGLMVFVLFVLSWFKMNADEYNLWIPWWITFALFNVLKLQADIAYNIFLFFIVCYPLGTICFLATLYRFILAPAELEAKGVAAGVSSIVVVSCTLSGAMGIWRQIGNCRPAWGVSEEQVVNWILKKTSTDAVFMAPLAPFNPFAVLTGRTMFMEHPEVMAHVGFDHTAREHEWSKFLQTNQSETISKTVNYIVKTPETPGIDKGRWKEVFSNRDFSIYQKIA